MNSLKFSASFDTLLDARVRGEKVKEISQFTQFVLKFENSGALYNFFLFFKVSLRVSFIILKVIKRVFLTFS